MRFLLEYGEQSGDPKAWRLVRQSLDALLDSPMRDPLTGGFAVFSHTPDWTVPAAELDGLDQAGLLLVLLAAAERDAGRYEPAARALLEHIATYFFEADTGRFHGRLLRLPNGNWWRDPAVYADRNALLASASARAALQLADEGAASMARSAAAFLVEHCVAADGGVYYYILDGQPALTGLLEAQALVGQALADVAELDGDTLLASSINRILGYAEAHLFDEENGAFLDRVGQEGQRGSLLPFADGTTAAGNPLVAELYARLDRVDRAAAVLGGKRLKVPASRAHCTGARAVLLCKKAKRTAL